MWNWLYLDRKHRPLRDDQLTWLIHNIPLWEEDSRSEHWTIVATHKQRRDVGKRLLQLFAGDVFTALLPGNDTRIQTRAQQFKYRYVYVFTSRCLAVKGGIHFTGPLSSNHKKLHMTHTVGGMDEVCWWDGLRRHDIHTKFNKDRFRYSQVNRRGVRHI